MNLEEIETLCINYLSQKSNPLVQVSALHKHLQRQDDKDLLSEQELLKFLRAHELFQVVEGPGDTDQLDPALFATAGLDATPRVILSSHIPSRDQMLAMMAQQLEEMTAALLKAQASAEKEGVVDPEKLQEALERTEALKEKMRIMFQGDGTE